jgi:predicted nuclease of predicted toxin-antitoxin system
MKLLFDVHCQLQYQSSGAEIEKNHEVICVDHHPELPVGIEDPKIAAFAKEYGYIVVTKDVDFVNYCKSENIPVGVLKGNRLYLIKDSITLFGVSPPNRLFTQD